MLKMNIPEPRAEWIASVRCSDCDNNTFAVGFLNDFGGDKDGATMAAKPGGTFKTALVRCTNCNNTFEITGEGD